jgi:hypothetical protein
MRARQPWSSTATRTEGNEPLRTGLSRDFFLRAVGDARITAGAAAGFLRCARERIHRGSRAQPSLRPIHPLGRRRGEATTQSASGHRTDAPCVGSALGFGVPPALQALCAGQRRDIPLRRCLPLTSCCCTTGPIAPAVADRAAGWRSKSSAKSMSLRVLRVRRGEGHWLRRIARSLSLDERPSGRASKATFLTLLSSALGDK